MSIEEEIFKKATPDYQKLLAYGFIKADSIYHYEKALGIDDLIAKIDISDTGDVSGIIFDKDVQDEYQVFRVEGAGKYAYSVREKYEDILNDILANCFHKSFFLMKQTERLVNYIQQKYKVDSEFLWKNYPGYSAYRNKSNQKWFVFIMNVKGDKFGSGDKREVEIIGLKLNDEVASLLSQKGFYPAYHMNKQDWISIVLDDTLTDDEITSLIDKSYHNVSLPSRFLIPANPEYYDIISHFQREELIFWKQPKNCHVGDIVYIYLGKPYAAILYRLEVIKTDITSEDKKNLLMQMKLTKRYEKDTFTRAVLASKYGVDNIRGARGIPDSLAVDLDK